MQLLVAVSMDAKQSDYLCMRDVIFLSKNGKKLCERKFPLASEGKCVGIVYHGVEYREKIKKANELPFSFGKQILCFYPWSNAESALDFCSFTVRFYRFIKKWWENFLNLSYQKVGNKHHCRVALLIKNRKVYLICSIHDTTCILKTNEEFLIILHNSCGVAHSFVGENISCHLSSEEFYEFCFYHFSQEHKLVW